MVWSLKPFRRGFLQAIGATAPKTGDLTPWLESDEADDLNLIRALVRRSVLSTHRRHLLWHGLKKVAYFRRRDEREWQPVKYSWSGTRARTVVKPMEAKLREGHTAYRHDAAYLQVRRLAGSWYLQVKPTYLFTWDGHQLSGHHDSYLSGIKKIETHPAVSQALRMWEHLLIERLQIDERPGPLGLGGLVQTRAPVSITDKAWKPLKAEDLGFADRADDDLTLFGPEDPA